MSKANKPIIAGADYQKDIIKNKGAVDTIFKGHVIFNKANYETITFGKCVFENLVSIEDCTFEGNLNFVDCIFNNGLRILRTSMPVLRFDSNDFTSSGLTIDTPVLSHLILKANKIQKLIFASLDSGTGFRTFELLDNDIEESNFLECKFDGSINLKSNSFEELEINKSVLNYPCTFESCNIKTLWLLNSQIDGGLSIPEKHNHFQDLNIQSCHFEGRFDLGCKIEGHLYIHKTDFEEQVVFNKYLNCNIISLTNIYCKRLMSIEINSNIDSLTVDDSSFDVSLQLSGHYVNEVNFGRNLHFTVEGVVKGNMVINDCAIWLLDLDCINLGMIFFDRVRTRWIILKGFHNLNRMVMGNLILDDENSIIIIHESNVGRAEFLNIDFSLFKEVVVAKSNLSELILTNSTFPDTITLESNHETLGYKLERNELKYVNTYFRDSYRQLKIAMEKHGNKSKMLAYKAKEMQYLKKEIRSWLDKTLLCFNYTSNRHGTSWIHGVKFTLASALLFFIPYIFTEQGSVTTVQFVESYLNFVTSFPKLEIRPHSDQSGISNLLVFLARIFMSYGIYQTITAFRKYGRK